MLIFQLFLDDQDACKELHLYFNCPKYIPVGTRHRLSWCRV